jgi:hypothetical protein
MAGQTGEMRVATESVRSSTGKFNSPHTLAADSGGNLYVTERLLGGRLTKLGRAESRSTYPG